MHLSNSTTDKLPVVVVAASLTLGVVVVVDVISSVLYNPEKRHIPMISCYANPMESSYRSTGK